MVRDFSGPYIKKTVDKNGKEGYHIDFEAITNTLAAIREEERRRNPPPPPPPGPIFRLASPPPSDPFPDELPVIKSIAPHLFPRNAARKRRGRQAPSSKHHALERPSYRTSCLRAVINITEDEQKEWAEEMREQRRALGEQKRRMPPEPEEPYREWQRAHELEGQRRLLRIHALEKDLKEARELAFRPWPKKIQEIIRRRGVRAPPMPVRNYPLPQRMVW